MPLKNKTVNNNSTDSAFFSTEDPELIAEREANGEIQPAKIFGGVDSTDRSRSASGDKPAIFTSKSQQPAQRAKSRTLSESATGPSVVVVSRGQKNARKSRAGKGPGGPKKEGCGGNYTWGKATTNYGDAAAILDSKDPNYDSAAEGEEDSDFLRFQKMPIFTDSEKTIPEIKTMLDYLIQNGDVKENVADLVELNLSDGAKYELIRIIINKLFDQKANGREICSEFIADAISQGLIEEIDFKIGIEKFLFEDFKDVLVDYTDAPTIMKKFIIRATADHALSIAQIEVMKHDPKIANEPAFLSVFEGAHTALTTSAKSLYHVHTIWGITGIRPTNELTNAIEDIIDEFGKGAASADEIAAELRELEVPHFNHEIARVIIMKAIEPMNKNILVNFAKLIGDLEKKGILTIDAVKGGFKKIYRDINDIKEDLPPAPLLIQVLLNQLCNLSVIDADFARHSCPRDHNSRMRTLSENPENGRFNIEWNDYVGAENAID